jgi:hypothetical protein
MISTAKFAQIAQCVIIQKTVFATIITDIGKNGIKDREKQHGNDINFTNFAEK